MKSVCVEIDGGPSFRQPLGDRVMRAALRAGVAFPYECNSGSCGCCRFELLSGTVEVAWLEAPAWTDRDRRKRRYLGCQTCATSDAVIRVMPDEKVLAGQRPQKFNAILIAKRWVTHDMCMLVFHSDGPAEFLPGQYAIVRAPDVPARCYSMSNLPNDSGDWEFIVRRVPGGKSSEAIVDSELGAPFELDGPYGMAFFREAGTEDLVCVAGGSGLAPMLSIARAADAAGRSVEFFYGGRRPQDMACIREIEALAGFGTRLRVHAAISSPHPAEDSHWTGERCLLPDLLKLRLGAELSRYRFYAAGAPVLMSALEEMLVTAHALPPERLHFDRFQ